MPTRVRRRALVKVALYDRSADTEGQRLKGASTGRNVSEAVSVLMGSTGSEALSSRVLPLLGFERQRDTWSERSDLAIMALPWCWAMLCEMGAG